MTIKTITVSMICPYCHASHSVECRPDAYSAWVNGEKIQDVMPELSPCEREQLISQMCLKCQNKFFWGE